MKKTIAIYGFVLALLTFLLKFIEYRFLIRELSTEFFVGIVALFFTALGVWMGIKITGKSPDKNAPKASAPSTEDQPLTDPDTLGISQREFEVLTLIAKGYSNQQIADQLFLSLNTVKTHTSNLFAKLDVKRRTQAVQKAGELGILPK